MDLIYDKHSQSEAIALIGFMEDFGSERLSTCAPIGLDHATFRLARVEGIDDATGAYL
jgi:hypothetical protein